MGQPVCPENRVRVREVDGPREYGGLVATGRHTITEFLSRDGTLLRRSVDWFPPEKPDGSPDIVEFYSKGELVLREVLGHPVRSSSGKLLFPPGFDRELLQDGKVVYKEGNSPSESDLLLRDERMTTVIFLDEPGGRWEGLTFAGPHSRNGREVGTNYLDPAKSKMLFSEDDTDGDGKIDEITVWENGLFSTTRIYSDKNGDGKPDTVKIEYYEDPQQTMEITRTETRSVEQGELQAVLRKIDSVSEPEGTPGTSPTQARQKSRSTDELVLSRVLIFALGLAAGAVLCGVWQRVMARLRHGKTAESGGGPKGEGA
jgi:hypothetical protein